MYAERGPDSVERIARDEPLIEKIVQFLTALWIRVIAPEIFEIRVPRDLLPFVVPETSPDNAENMCVADFNLSPSAAADTGDVHISLSSHDGHYEPADPSSHVSQGSSFVRSPSPVTCSSHTKEEILVVEALLNAFTANM